MKKALIILSILLVPSLASAKNVILFIGDGMGTSIISATRYYKDANGDGNLFIDSIPLLAHVKTKSWDNVVTDSAAATTAFATCVKAQNNCLGLGPRCSLDNRLTTIAERASEAGVSVGLVT